MIATLYAAAVVGLFTFAFKKPVLYGARVRKSLVQLLAILILLEIPLMGVKSDSAGLFFAWAFWGTAIFAVYAHLLPAIARLFNPDSMPQNDD